MFMDAKNSLDRKFERPQKVVETRLEKLNSVLLAKKYNSEKIVKLY